MSWRHRRFEGKVRGLHHRQSHSHPGNAGEICNHLSGSDNRYFENDCYVYRKNDCYVFGKNDCYVFGKNDCYVFGKNDCYVFGKNDCYVYKNLFEILAVRIKV